MRAAALTGGVVAVLALACGGSKPPPAEVRTVSTRCPDLTKLEEVGTFDYVREYQLSRDAADKLKAAALASVELGLLEEKLDADLGLPCAQIASSLGDKAQAKNASEACAAALKVVRDTRAKLGAKAALQLVVRAPVCQVDESLMTKCAAICDGSVPAAKVKAECEQKVGRCDGTCTGTCEAKEPQKCDGACSGTCEGQVRGACGGRCKGTCDGKPVNGACAGACVGTCSGGAFVGDCKGTCLGSCRFAKGGICKELCSGTCSVDLSDAKCAGDFRSPEVSTGCRARCELAAMNKADCSTPQVGLVITGGASKPSEDALRVAVEKSYPALLEILYEVGDKGPTRVHDAGTILAAARAGFKEMALSGGKGTAAASEAQLGTCFDEPFKKATASAAALKTLLDQAQGLRDDVAK